MLHHCLQVQETVVDKKDCSRISVMIAARVQQKHDAMSSLPTKPVNALPLAFVVERMEKINPILSGGRK